MSDLNTRASKGVILLVDDTPSDVHQLSDFLTGKGFDVRFESSGRAAIQTAVNDPPEIILLDVKMPEMDGYEVCERLKAVGDLKSIPVLFIGVLDETIDKVKGFDVGGADHITKPFEFAEVLVRVEAHLTNARMKIQLEIVTRELDAARKASKRLHANLEGQVRRRTAELEDTNKALREIKTQFEAVYNHHYQLTGLIDKEGRLLMGNRTALEFAGIEAEDVIGKRFWETPWWTHSQEAQRMLQEAMERAMRGEMVNFESTHISAAGETKNIDFRIGPVFDDDGEVIYLVPEGYDITERKQAEEALRESEEKYRTFFENSCDAMMMLQNDLIVECNAAAVAALGYQDAKDLLNTHPSKISPEYQPDGKKSSDKALEMMETVYTHGTHRFEWEHITMNGDVFPVEVSLTATPSEGERKSIAVWRDIADRKRAEEKVLQEKRFSDTVINSLPGIFFVFNPQGYLVRWNLNYEKVLGLSSEEMSTFQMLQLVDEENRELVSQKMQEVFELGHATLETHLLTKRGDKIPYFLTGVSMRTEDEVYLVGTGIDVTDRKRDEEELAKYRYHLEELVKERSRELEEAQKQLIRKERLAALGQLTATVSHELRNPLGTVSTSVFSIGDAIKRNEFERVDRALKLAERNIQRCDGIITELLDFTRKRELKPEPIDIDTWLSDLLDEQEISEGIECKRDFRTGLLIPIDREYLRRAVINVVTNAVQALQEEESTGNRLMVESKVAGDRLEIRIRDTGPGMSADALDKVFEPLFSTKGFGIGLGLPIVKDIMVEHGGGIEIQSEVEKGTTVVLWLPLRSDK